MSKYKKTETKKVAYIAVGFGNLSDAATKIIDGLLADKSIQILDITAIEQEHASEMEAVRQYWNDKLEAQRVALQSNIDKLTAQLENLSSDIADKEQSLDASVNSVAELQKLNAKNLSEKDTEISSLKESVTRLTAELGTLSSELGTAQSAADLGFQTIKSGKKVYRVHGKKWRFQGRDITLDELKKDSELVKKLLDLGVGFLTELKTKEA